MKKVLIISTSLRSGSNSELLAQAFKKGAEAAGHDVTLVSLKGKNIAFCKGCMACGQTGKCVIKDDANEIVEQMMESDVIVWATPVYYYSMSGQMKTLMDRANSLYYSEYNFREVYGLVTAAEDQSNTAEGTFKGIQGWVDCFEGVTLYNILFIGGVADPEDVRETSGLDKAYRMGKKI